jgi:hypothetical protein
LLGVGGRQRMGDQGGEEGQNEAAAELHGALEPWARFEREATRTFEVTSLK